MTAKETSMLGQYLLSSVKSALKSKGKGKIVRSKINVAEIRKQLGMTQKKFSESYYIKLETLRNWEQQKRTPDTATMAYLACIASHPKEILHFLRDTKYL